MDHIQMNDLESMSEEELKKLKKFLFEEQIRIQAEEDKQKQVYEKFKSERETFFEEMKALNHKVHMERKRLKDETMFFEKKVQILKNGFFQLDLDRKQFEREKKINQQKMYDYLNENTKKQVPPLFRGITSSLGLKKRYRDLLKIYHPDNSGGDRELMLEITKQYENLKNKY